MAVTDHGLEALRKAAVDLLGNGREYAFKMQLVDADGNLIELGGSSMVTTGTRSSPVLISSLIDVPSDEIAKMFIQGNGGPVTPTLASGSIDNQSLTLFGCSDSDLVTLSDSSNLELYGGECILGNKSVLKLLWDEPSTKWTEEGRNEI